MKAVISCTADENYSYFIPLATWCWNKLDVGVILFLPESSKKDAKIQLGLNCMNYGYKENNQYYFDMPKHKEATAAQCVRLYAACLDLPEDEVLVTSDVDMGIFSLPPYEEGFTIFGADLVPQEQIPMCYISAKVKDWRKAFKLEGKTYQECLDELLGHIETEHFRGNYWGKDQETAYNLIAANQIVYLVSRARQGTQFATHRVDRDDSFWRDRVSNQLVDAHLWRPGYEQQNFANILELLTLMYPFEDFTWLVEYTEQYKELL